MKTHDSAFMGKMPITRLIFYVAVPIAVGYVVVSLNTIVDSFWVSRLGEDELSGVGLATPFFMFVSFLVEAVGVGATATIAKALGAGDKQKVSRLVVNTFILCGIMAVTATIVGLIAFPPLIKFSAGSEAHLGELAEAYIMPFVFCVIIYAVHWAYTSFLNAAGKTRLPMIASVTGILCNMGLTPLFLFVFDMGIAGAMWGTILSIAISTIMVVVFNYAFNREVVAVITPVRLTRDIRNIISFALPTFLTWVSFSVVGFLTNYNLLKFGKDALDVAVIYGRFETFVLCLLWAVSGAMLSIISYNLGEKNIDRVRETMKKGILISWLSIIPMTVVVSLLGRQLSGLLNASNSAAAMAAWAFPIIMGNFYVLGLRAGFEDCIKALGRPYLAMSTVLVRQVILVPIMFLIAEFGTLPWLFAIWTLLELPALAYAYWVFRRTKKKVLQVYKVSGQYEVYGLGGNTTAIITKDLPEQNVFIAADKIMRLNKDIEQVAVIENVCEDAVTFKMAGGEFCGNACRAVAEYMRKNHGYKKSRLIINGIEIQAESDGKVSKVSIPKNVLIQKTETVDNRFCVFMNGITQIIVPQNFNDNKERAEQIRQDFERQYKTADALGIIFYADGKIDPFVWVTKIKTFFNETACVSGSIAAALFSKKANTKIIQPTGEVYTITVGDNTVTASGKVEFLQSGTL